MLQSGESGSLFSSAPSHIFNAITGSRGGIRDSGTRRLQPLTWAQRPSASGGRRRGLQLPPHTPLARLLSQTSLSCRGGSRLTCGRVTLRPAASAGKGLVVAKRRAATRTPNLMLFALRRAGLKKLKKLQKFGVILSIWGTVLGTRLKGLWGGLTGLLLGSLGLLVNMFARKCAAIIEGEVLPSGIADRSAAAMAPSKGE